MMRSNDPLENQLSRIPLRAPPTEWRDSILAAAEGAIPKKSAQFVWPEWVQFILNPRPVSWAAVAAVWALAFIFNSQTPGGNAGMAASSSEPISTILHERQEMLASAVEGERIIIPAPRKRVPGPQGRAPITLIFV